MPQLALHNAICYLTYDILWAQLHMQWCITKMRPWETRLSVKLSYVFANVWEHSNIGCIKKKIQSRENSDFASLIWQVFFSATFLKSFFPRTGKKKTRAFPILTCRGKHVPISNILSVRVWFRLLLLLNCVRSIITSFQPNFQPNHNSVTTQKNWN